MNARQKTGVGMILGIIVFAIPAIVEAFGGTVPGWVPIAATLVSSIAGVLGITVNLPANTNKVQ